MADTTDVLALPYPEGADANDVPADIQALAERIDEVPGIESLTSAEIAALTSAQKPAGRVVWNSTTSKLQVSNGTTFADVADPTKLPLAGGTMTGTLTMSGATIAMGSQKITGLADGTDDTDAATKGQADAAKAHFAGYLVSEVIFDASTTTLTWTEDYDGDSMHSAGVVTVPVDGLYLCTLMVRWATDFSGFRDTYVLKNNSVYIAQDRSPLDGVLNPSISGLCRLAAGDNLRAKVYQDSTGSQTIADAKFHVTLLGTTS